MRSVVTAETDSESAAALVAWTSATCAGPASNAGESVTDSGPDSEPYAADLAGCFPAHLEAMPLS